jgi:hypothetical protein
VKALLALAAAAALVLAAVLVRGAIDDDDSSAAAGDLTVICPPELEGACGAIAGGVQVRVEPTGETGARLVEADDAADVGADVWLTTAPWAEIVGSERERAGRDDILGGNPRVLARSPVVIVAYEDAAAALEGGACAPTVDWACLGEVAERPWSEVGGEGLPGTVKVGLTDPATATGLVVLGGAAAGYLDRSDYAANDFDTPGFTTWLSALGATAPEARSGDVVNQMLTFGRGRFALVGSLEADALQADDRDDIRVIYPSPVATADLVAVPIGDPSETAVDAATGDDLRDALAADGWRVGGEGDPSGIPLPDDDGLPDGDVLGALLELWDQVAG